MNFICATTGVDTSLCSVMLSMLIDFTDFPFKYPCYEIFSAVKIGGNGLLTRCDSSFAPHIPNPPRKYSD